ncbi:MAG: alkaline phosphatase family protein [Lentisphaeria bacterium]|nr:alkaline phosphatase family protein [Lentisphaeria bacterium]
MNEISREVLKKYMDQYQLDHTIGDLTPTLCALFGVPEPAECGAAGVAAVVDQAEHLTGRPGGIARGLIFCPDAVGEVHRQKYPEKLARVEKLAGFRIPSASVMPSVTPVCYGTIFSGASPTVHGIRKYEKPVLEIPTLFDVFAEAGKEVAIVSVNHCSIDTIFRRRKVDYYSFRTDAQSFEMTKKLLEEDKYDLIISYYTSYDHLSHKHGPYAPVSEDALETAVRYFEELTALTDRVWQRADRVVAWVPDHGNHVVDEHSGTHGTNTPEDMVVNHFYRLRAAE